MKDDIVARLRGITNGTSWANYLFAVQDAADEIERLRAELRTHTGDGHDTKGEPCTQNTPS